MKSRHRYTLALSLALGAAFAIPQLSSAQTSGDGFLFKRPVASISLHGGFSRANAGSEVFSFATDLLTLGRGDFNSFAAGARLGAMIHPRIELALDATYTGRSTGSEFRDWVDMDDLPIEQTTKFARLPITVNAKYYVLPRGRTVGSFAWVPAKYAPYVGAGAGMTWYEFRQEGDFVDFVDNSVFYDELESHGWARAAQALAGIDVSLTPRLVITGETRYLWSNADLQADFQDFDDIDLSGFSATVGITLRN